MPFEEFQATKRRMTAKDYAAQYNDAWFEDQPDMGTLLVYGDGFWIEEHLDGRYHLLIGNQEWIRSELESLERELYDYALSEGILEKK